MLKYILYISDVLLSNSGKYSAKCVVAFLHG